VSLELIASLVIAHGYPLLFTIIALDCAFLPIPGELLLLTFGGIAVQAQFDLGIGIAVAALAVLVGDSINYWLGRFGGKRVMNKFRFAQRWTLGAPSIVFGRFVIGARVVVAPLAGARRMPFGRFLLFDAIGATLWAGAFVLIGYGARVNLAAAQQHWTSVANTIQFILIAAIATYLAVKLMKLPRLPIAVGVALIAFAALRPATASSQGDTQFAALRINHDPLRAIPVGLSSASSASN
jgi:membrane protein DedA with SNARE-associated domain